MSHVNLMVPTVHLRQHLRHFLNLVLPILFCRHPFAMLDAAPHYGPLCGLPRPMMITSGINGARAICAFVSPLWGGAWRSCCDRMQALNDLRTKSFVGDRQDDHGSRSSGW